MFYFVLIFLPVQIICGDLIPQAYASMLYLRKFENFKIILRGKQVEQYNIADELRHPKVVTYRPQVSTALKEVSLLE